MVQEKLVRQDATSLSGKWAGIRPFARVLPVCRAPQTVKQRPPEAGPPTSRPTHYAMSSIRETQKWLRGSAGPYEPQRRTECLQDRRRWIRGFHEHGRSSSGAKPATPERGLAVGVTPPDLSPSPSIEPAGVPSRAAPAPYPAAPAPYPAAPASTAGPGRLCPS